MKSNKKRFTMSINRKLHAGFIVSAVFILFMIVFSYSQIHKVQASYDNLLDLRGNVMVDIKDLEAVIAKQNSDIRGYILTQDKQMLSGIETSFSQLPNLLGKLNDSFTDHSQQERLGQMTGLNTELHDISEEIIQYVKERKLIEAEYLLTSKFQGVSQQFNVFMQELAENQLTIIYGEQVEIDQRIHSMVRTNIIYGILAIVISMTMGSLISNRISKRLTKLKSETKRIAAGDLTGETLNFRSRDELEELGESFNQMKDNLKELIAGIDGSSNLVAFSANELMAGSEQVSTSANQVAITIQDMSADAGNMSLASDESAKGMEGIANQFQQIVESIGIVAEMSSVAATQVEVGNSSIAKAIKQMNVIHESVAESYEVVSLLDQKSLAIESMIANITEITSQTELLSLNAAIEAARAGEQGRGFAVVANEIKKLAEHSNQASKQIINMVNEIRKYTERIMKEMEHEREEVQNGVTVINQANEAFNTIMQSVLHVTQQTQEVSASSEEVSAVTEEVVASVESISDLAKVSASHSINIASIAEEQLASMKEITDSVTNLTELASELQTNISKFKV
ncbi:methyl-accepting chemotaxis protein [Paenibacillus albiflavus]|uniref:Methyl-accepting chemotaxis protein n=1 Tax=Paenibacillus albiflavus TaxID=2545760 RepID=A0A4R4E691_9BACL|nr:methyl-accepting chemotaxis protein [Paenibacillus albiflavus]TCZ75196.1 methyl-accepting chemotaxis protein [Paenibacillus albiflavus]